MVMSLNSVSGNLNSILTVPDVRFWVIPFQGTISPLPLRYGTI
jgi:hypothetical protein